MANLSGTISSISKMYKRDLILVVVCVELLACSEKGTTIDSGLKSFWIEATNSPYDLQFNLPETFVSVMGMDERQEIDTTDIALNWIFTMQDQNPDAYCFFDSLDTKQTLLIKAGPRADVSNEERDLTYFSVPTVKLSMIFPPATDKVRITHDSGERQFGEKTYYKRRYQDPTDIGTFSDYYYITTKWQSVLIIVNGTKELNLDKYIRPTKTFFRQPLLKHPGIFALLQQGYLPGTKVPRKEF